LACGSCATELPPDSRFWNKCGAPITPAATSAEYKQVTVLFADVVHSMDIAATAAVAVRIPGAMIVAMQGQGHQAIDCDPQ
jgi:hypothetical protein